MKNVFKLCSLVLAVIMALGMVACGENATVNNDFITYTDPYASIESYDERSKALYDDILGEFYMAYRAAREETNVSKRWALMAIAEAKLLETGVILPLTSLGGSYEMSRVAPHTSASVLWGNDPYRYHDAIVTTEFITASHREEMKAKWKELRGTGTYEIWANTFLIENGYAIKDTYSIGYDTDPETWDALATTRLPETMATANTYSGLYEYNADNELVPALALSYTVSEDGLKYTFKLREKVKWVNAKGEAVGDLSAYDFVAGMQHMLDAKGGLEYTVCGVIDNADKYIRGELTDFSKVGVKALDRNTLVYTLEQPAPYFISMLTSSAFAPLCKSYYESHGGKFGAEYDPGADDYTYGMNPNHIAYCGPYTVTNFIAEEWIEFTRNESYWNKDNMKINKLVWRYESGEDELKAYNDAKESIIDTVTLNSFALDQAKEEKAFDMFVYVSDTDATTEMSLVNINRSAYANAFDGSLTTTLTQSEQVRSRAALRNKHFRLAITFALNRSAYNAQSTDEEIKYTSLINSCTPGDFVALEEAVTVSINGKDITYPIGTYYGEIMQDQLNADGVKIKVWNPEANEGEGSGYGFDGWHNVNNAIEELNAAITELKKIGITVTKDKPIVIEMPYFCKDLGEADAYRQSIETSLGGLVKLKMREATYIEDFCYAGYDISFGYEANYDLYNGLPLRPAYSDPQTYLDAFMPRYAGIATKRLGIY